MAAPSYPAETNASGNPIGGGPGYSRIVTSGDYTATDRASLVTHLAAAASGETVFIAGGTTIDMDGGGVNVPAGVTLASDRGNGTSVGGLLVATVRLNGMVNVVGSGARITGLRLEGNNKSTTWDNYSRGIWINGATRGNCEIDNCELFGHQYAAVAVVAAQGCRVHHCNIHQNRAAGLGYGTVAGSGAHVVLEGNDYTHSVAANRHSIADDGTAGVGWTVKWCIFQTDTHGEVDAHRRPGFNGDMDPAGHYHELKYCQFTTDPQHSAGCVGIAGIPDVQNLSEATWAKGASGSGGKVFQQGRLTPFNYDTGTFTRWTVQDIVYGHTFTPYCELWGDATRAATATQANIVAGGKEVILRVIHDTVVAAGASFDGARQATIDGSSGDGSSSGAWNNTVRTTLAVTDVTRISDKAIKVTLPAVAGYNPGADENVSWTIPAAMLVGGVAAPQMSTFKITATPAPAGSGFNPMRMSDYLENALLDHLVGNASLAVPTNHLGLSPNRIVDSDTGSTVVETDYGSYARITIPSARWGTPTVDGQITNIQALTFPTPTVDASNGNVIDCGTFDALTLGNMLFYAICSVDGLDINSGSQAPNFAPGAFTVKFTKQTSHYFRQKILNHLFHGTSYVPPATLYLGLSPNIITPIMTGSTVVETDYTSYARLATTSADWNNASGGTMTNSAALTWATATGPATNGNIKWLGIFDAASAGNLLAFGPYGNSPIQNAQYPEIGIGDFTLSAA